jgi:hypothetical protein
MIGAFLVDDCEEASIPEECEEPPVDCDEPAADSEECDDHPQLLVNVVQVLMLKPEGPPEEIFSGEEIFDLFTLKDGVELKFFKDNLEPGLYNKIRLIIEGDPMLYNEEYPEGTAVKLPSGKIDLNPKGDFLILPGDSVLITLDWHAHKSIKYEAGPNKILRPVIFVDIEIEGRERIVRVSGIVGEEISTDGFELCRAVYTRPLGVGAATDGGDEPADEHCINIVVTGKTGIFDENGEPQTLDMLISGDPVTVIGLLRTIDEMMDECAEASIPEDECNIVSPLLVAKATSDDDSDSDSDDRPVRRFEVIAAVVEEGLPGTWERYRGSLETAADGLGEFDFRLSGPEGRLLTGKVYEETRIFLLSKEDGITEIEATDLAAGDKAIVEAVFAPGDDFGPTPKQAPDDCSEASIPEECLGIPEKLDGTLRIAIMLVRIGDDTTPPDLPDFVGGKLLSANVITGELVVTTAAGDRCIETDDETAIFQIISIGEEVEAIKATVGELIIGSLTLATGTQNGCLDASIVVSEGAEVTTPEPTP